MSPPVGDILQSLFVMAYIAAVGDAFICIHIVVLRRANSKAEGLAGTFSILP
jgi:hypothetical protein